MGRSFANALTQQLFIPEFAELWKRGRAFHKFRSKTIAHRDVDVIHKSFVEVSGCLTYNDEKKLLDDTCRLFGVVSERDNVPDLPPFTPDEDLLSLVMVLNKAHAA